MPTRKERVTDSGHVLDDGVAEARALDQRGVVRNIEKFGLEDGYVIVLDRRVTDSSVQDKGFLRQLLGNIGQFSPSNIPGAS